MKQKQMSYTGPTSHHLLKPNLGIVILVHRYELTNEMKLTNETHIQRPIMDPHVMKVTYNKVALAYLWGKMSYLSYLYTVLEELLFYTE